MPQIKTSLKQLFGLFVQSAEDQALDMPNRQLAARTTVLIAHMQRIDAKLDKVLNAGIALEKKVDATLTELLPKAAPPAEGAEGETVAPGEEDGDQMASRVLAETEAEAAALRAGTATTPPVVPPNNGNGSPQQAITPIRPAAPPTPKSAS